MILFIIVFVILVVLYFKFRNRFKFYVPQTINVVTGAPKTCKSALSLHLALKDYRKRLCSWWIARYIFFRKNLEKPLFYSNIPLDSIPYVPLSNDLLLRKKRFAYGSVVFFDEFYLVADSMDYKDENVNTNLSLLFKLFGHETHGGALYLNTQNRSDLHFSARRCALSYIYIFKKDSLPFFMRLQCRELLNSEDLDIRNVINDDPSNDPSFRNFYFSKRIFKRYDCYALSSFTDALPVANNVKFIKGQSLKLNYLLTLKPKLLNKYLYTEVSNENS